jgi:hypothetical protein
LALAVVGGGVFAKYLRNAGWPEVPVSFEDAARATSSQVHDLVRYVEQSNPHLVEGLLAALLQDGMTMTALDASVAGHHDQAPLESPRLEAGVVPSGNETEPRNLPRGGWPVRNASIVNSCLEQ